MQGNYHRFLLAVVGMFILTSCQSVLTPRVVLWHTWEGEEASVINSAVARFSEIFDDVVVVASSVPADDIVERYIIASEQGLGPDIFIAPNTSLSELADAGLIEPIPDDTLNPSLYYTASLATATYHNQLYGVPFAMRPLAMYYNRTLVGTPATTLSELLTQAESGTGSAINTQFRQILWGIQGFGGQLVDDNGRVILNQGAFTNWLNWLLTANANPEIFLSRDATTLRQLFIEGRVAYYTGMASELAGIRAEMGHDTIGVAPLPAGPSGASGPLMQSDLLMFNSSSSPSSHESALELAVFLTNLEQSNTFMRDLQLVPTNRRVRVDLRTYPAIAGFIEQTRTSVSIPYLPQVTRLIEEGDNTLLQVLEGVLEPNTAADQLTTTINAEFGLDTVEVPQSCDLVGDITLWHSLTNSAESYLETLKTRLNVNCFDFDLEIVYVPATDIVSAYLEVYNLPDAPDIVLTESTNITELAEASAISSIDREMMQAFSPVAQQTVTSSSTPYGVPVAINGNVFYYNRDIVADAPVTTDALLVEASPPFAISRNTSGMFWTLTAYNGISIVDNAIIADEEQLTAWVSWLQRVRNAGHINITANQFLRNSQFVQGQSVYYIDSSLKLAELSADMGDALGVAQFPTGTSPFASSIVTSLALTINPESEKFDTALAFAQLVTDVEEQDNMVEALRWIPSNTTADANLSTDPALATIASVLQRGVVIKSGKDTLLSEVGRAIDRAFRTDQSAEEIATDLFVALSEGEID